MMQKLWKSAFILCISLAVVIGVSAQQTTTPAQPMQLPYDVVDSPVDVLSSYYNAINLKDYTRAYNYWRNHEQTLADFSAGFSDTANTQLIVQPPTWIDGAAGSLFSSIQTVLVVQHTDNTQHLYAGCFVVRKSNLEPPDTLQLDTWHIDRGEMIEINVNEIVRIHELLADACAE